ncbi:MAG: aspartate aminotransferase family protein [Thermomicrobiales bacterium]
MSNTDVIAPSDLFTRSRNVMAGGVSASMPMHPYLGMPLYVERGDGPFLYGIDGKRYIDLNMGNGAAILGHRHPAVSAAIARGLDAGIIAASETPFQAQLAERLVEIIPAAERVRFSTTGTEVTTLALRIARHVTGRTRYLKFDGQFHGLAEQWLYQRKPDSAGNLKVMPSSAGVPADGVADVEMVAWNDAEGFAAAMDQHGDELAAVICEPIHFNAGCIPPMPGFLELLRERTREHGTILIFDEVLSGFRTALGGVQAESGVTPDLTTHAKAMANGMPISSLSGGADLMETLLPAGQVAHSGTYSGHLLSVLAAIATLGELSAPGVYPALNATAERFYADLQDIFNRADLPIVVQGRGARFGLYFGRRDPVRTWSDAAGHDHEMNSRFSLACLERGVFIHAYTKQGPPGHAGFSLAHTDEDLAQVLSVAEEVAASLA